MRVEFKCENTSATLSINGSDELSLYTGIVSYLLVLVNGGAPDSDSFFFSFEKLALMNETESIQMLLKLTNSNGFLKQCSFAIETASLEDGYVNISYIPIENYPGNLELLICALSFLKLLDKKIDLNKECLLEKIYETYINLLPLYKTKIDGLISQLQTAV